MQSPLRLSAFICGYRRLSAVPNCFETAYKYFGATDFVNITLMDSCSSAPPVADRRWNAERKKDGLLLSRTSGSRASRCRGYPISDEQRVNAIKMPLPFADQFYVLREHINFVRRRLAASTAAGGAR